MHFKEMWDGRDVWKSRCTLFDGSGEKREATQKERTWTKSNCAVFGNRLRSLGGNLWCSVHIEHPHSVCWPGCLACPAISHMLLPYERLVLHLKQPDLGHNTSRSTWVLMREEMLGHVDVAGIRDDKFGISCCAAYLHAWWKQAGWFSASEDAECTRKKGNIYLCFARSHPSFCSLWALWDLSLHVTRWELRFRDTLWGTELWLVRALSLTSPIFALHDTKFCLLLCFPFGWNAFAYDFFY